MDFITSALKNYNTPKNNINDWECITDFCGSWTFAGFRRPANFAADYSPSRNLTVFLGEWQGVKPYTGKLEEDACIPYVLQDNCEYSRRMRAELKKEEKRKAERTQVEEFYKTKGYNWVNITFHNPQTNENYFVNTCVGLRDWQTTLQHAHEFLKTKLKPGFKISKWKFETGISEKELELRNTTKNPQKETPKKSNKKNKIN
jgi:hypothetical protein